MCTVSVPLSLSRILVPSAALGKVLALCFGMSSPPAAPPRVPVPETTPEPVSGGVGGGISFSSRSCLAVAASFASAAAAAVAKLPCTDASCPITVGQKSSRQRQPRSAGVAITYRHSQLRSLSRRNRGFRGRAGFESPPLCPPASHYYWRYVGAFALTSLWRHYPATPRPSPPC